MITPLFLGFVALMFAVVCASSVRYMGGRTGLAVMAGLAVWLLYVGLLSYFGVVRNATMRPPGMVFLFVPLVVFVVLIVVRAASPAGARVALAFPLWMLLGAQTFRVIV